MAHDRKSAREAHLETELDRVAKFLLDKGFTLTALELHQELQEDGHSCERLRSYFAALSSRLTADTPPAPTGVVLNNYEVLLKQKEERIAILEYELRVGKEDIVTQQMELRRLQTLLSSPPPSSATAGSPAEKAVLSLLQKQSLNHAVHAYLLRENCKLSAVTLAGERQISNAASAAAPDLTQLFLAATTADSKIQSLQQEIERLREQLQKQKQQQQQSKIQPVQEIQSQTSASPASVSSETPSASVAAAQENKTRTEVGEELVEEEEERKQRRFLPVQEELDTSTKFGQQLARLAQSPPSAALVTEVLAERMPHITAGVLLNKREELLPPLIALICVHADKKMRDELTRQLFTLIKKPEAAQRRVLIDACIALAALVGTKRTGDEMLPLCWEQIGDKHFERRVLVAETCAALAPYIEAPLRSSLLLSILAQLAEDRHEAVRAAAARSYGLIIRYLSDVDKYPQIEEVMLRLLLDSELSVAATTREAMLPVVIDWLNADDSLCSLMGSRMLKEFVDTAKAATVGTESRVMRRIEVLSDCLLASFPTLFESVLIQSASPPLVSLLSISPAPPGTTDLLFLSSAQRQPLLDAFEALIKTTGEISVPIYFVWVTDTLIPSLLTLCGSLDLSNRPLVSLVAKFLNATCEVFGPVVTELFIRCACEAEIKRLAGVDDVQRGKVALFYLAAVLPNLDLEDLKEFLKKLITYISLEEQGWKTSQMNLLPEAVSMLCLRSEALRDVVVALLAEQVVHPAIRVRAATARLFFFLVNGLVDPQLLSRRILPVLLTLSNDIDPSVRLAAIAALGNVATAVTEPSVLERLNAQMDLLQADDTPGILSELLRTYNSILAHVKPPFRENFLLPKLLRAATKPPSRLSTDQALLIFECIQTAHAAVTDSSKQLLLSTLRALNDLGDVIPVESRAAFATMQRSLEEATTLSSDKKEEEKKDFVAPAAKALFSYLSTLTERKEEKKDG